MIRKLELEEMKTDLTYGHACYRELQFGRKFDPEHLQTMWGLFYAAGAGTVFVDIQNEEKVGVIGGVIYTDPFDKNLVAQELIWYVLPDKRNFGSTVRLKVAFEEWARQKGAKYIRMAAPHMNAGLAKLLQRSQYRHLEEIFEKELL